MLIQKNSKLQGNVGVGAAIAWFTKQGYVVSIPLNDAQEYDLVVDDGSKLRKVQVKTANHKDGDVYLVELRTNGGNRSRSYNKPFNAAAIDDLFIMVGDGSTYLIPTSGFENTSTISLGEKYIKFKL